jgi:iron complex outermembrane receptor protein
MGKYFMLFLCMNVLVGFAMGQTNYTLSGRVVDEINEALPGATVFLYPVKAGTTTDADGKFIINGLPKGSYVLEISYIGYQKLIDTLEISGDKFYKAQLKSTVLSLHEIVVTDNYAENRQREETLNLEIVNDDYLRQNLGGSIINSLERLPGVTAMDIGSGQSKPVIRGLGFNRVVVVENSIKHEAQQWGSDHGLEIDQYAIDNVEVIKGPASLMYGSDAIGGVIDMKNNRVPAADSFGGIVDLTGKTNNDLLGTSISLYGRKHWFFADLRATLIDYGDYKVPTDSVDIYSYRAGLYKNHLRNTAGQERNLHLSLGMIQSRFKSKIFISNVYSKSGFFANAHGLEPRNVDTDFYDGSSRDIDYPYQAVNHFKVINTSQYNLKKLNLEVDLGFQRNYRQEMSEYVDHGYMPPVFPDTLDFDSDLERQFEKYVYSANFIASYSLHDATTLKLGINTEYQDNRIDGRGFIIPAYRQFTAGGFAIARHTLSEKSMIQLGIRYDHGNIDTDAYYDWFPSPVITDNDTTMEYLQRAIDISRGFSNVSWSVGYSYHTEKWLGKVNLGKSFRMPIAKELAANGVNYHHFSYEIGNPDLSPEISWQLDVGVEYGSKRFAIGATPFLNYFANYIYLNPTSDHDRLYGNGNQVFFYTQSKVLRYGGEIHAHYEPVKVLQLGIIGEYVYSEQLSGEKKGFTLPFSPPASAIFNIKYKKQRIHFIENGYLSVDFRVAAAQDKIVPPEEPTDGYQVIYVRAGGVVKIMNQKVNFSFQVQNLLNARYFNHTSYYRLINVPEPGRNFIVNISIPFSGHFKSE